jgi:hypothetical protein
MKKSVKKLLENNQALDLFEDIKSTLYDKVAEKLDSMVEAVAPTVFESEELSEANFQQFGYVCFYNGKRVEVHAPSSLDARNKVAAMLKVPPKKQYLIAVKLAEKDGKPVNEDIEQIDEISKATLGSYIKKASHDVATRSAVTARYAERANKFRDKLNNKEKYTGDEYMQAKKDDYIADKNFNKSWKRRQGIAKAVDKLSEEEITEKQNVNMLGRYRLIDKNGNVVHSHDDRNEAIKKGKELGGFPHVRMVDTNKKLNEEEINEVSKQLLGNYVKKATSSNSDKRMDNFNKALDNLGMSNSRRLFTMDRSKNISHIEKNNEKILKREKFINKAVGKLTNEDMGAHYISTSHGGKSGKTFSTFVVNKKRTSKAAAQRKWSDLIKKNTPKQTTWDKHVNESDDNTEDK